MGTSLKEPEMGKLMKLALLLHIAAAGTWLGTNLAQAVGMMSAEKDGTMVPWLKIAQRFGRTLYPAAGVILLLTGAYLVTDMKISWGSTFVSIGFLVVLFGIVTGIFWFAPKTRQAIEELEAGKNASASLGGIRTMAIVDTALVLITMYMMIAHTGQKVA